MKYLETNIDDIPQELKKYNQWVNWRGETKDGNETKVPYNPSGGYAKTNDHLTWSTFNEVIKKINRFDGIGFVLTEDDPFVGIDLDDCRCPAFDIIDPKIQNHVMALNTYCEISPSGKGLRLLLKATIPVDGKKKGQYEIYKSKRYLTLTGQKLNSCSKYIENRQSEVDAFYQAIFQNDHLGKVQSSVNISDWDGTVSTLSIPENIKTIIQTDFPKGRRSEVLYSCVCSLVRAGYEDSIISTIILNNPIGEKAREKGANQDKWLQAQISKAREYIEERPSEIETSALLEFPNVFSGAAGEFAQVYSNYMEAPAHFWFTTYLTCLGNIASPKVNINTELPVQLRLFVLILGESAEVRKSTAIHKTIEFFLSTLGYEQFPTCHGIGSAEGLQKILGEHKNLILIFDEFRAFVSKCKIEGSVLLSCVNSLFELNRYQSITKKHNIDIQDVYLSILGASTIATYDRMWDASFTDIGFTNRLWLVPGSGEKKFSFPIQIPEAEKKQLIKSTNKIIKHIDKNPNIDITDKAKEMYHNWYMNIPNSTHSKRLDTYALRFMGLFALNDLKLVIDEDIVAKVIALCDWQFRVRQQYDPINADNNTAKMEEKIRRILFNGPKTERDLKRYAHVNRTGLWIYENAKKNLEKSNEIIRDKRTKKYISLK